MSFRRLPCATGVFSSRKLERASHDSLAFRFVAASRHSDHDRIAAFRRRFLRGIGGLFVGVLLLARGMGVLKMGTVALDGTKIHAGASRHSALSHEHAGRIERIEAQLKAGAAGLMALAEAPDQADAPDGMSVPEALSRRGTRLAGIARARAVIEAWAKERHARGKAAQDAKRAAREAKTKETGRKPGGNPPAPPAEGPLPDDPVNMTEEESRIMPVAGGGSDQCCNAQAVVAAGRLLVVAADVVQAPNDRQHLQPMPGRPAALPDPPGAIATLLAGSGYSSAANVGACAAAGIDPRIAMGRQAHHPPLAGRFAPAPPEPADPTPLGSMAQRRKTPGGKALCALRRHRPEPVFSILKSMPGFRQFPLRGQARVRGECSPVTIAWNIKRLEHQAPLRPQTRDLTRQSDEPPRITHPREITPIQTQSSAPSPTAC